MFSFLKKEKWLHLKTETLGPVAYSVDGEEKQRDVMIFVHFYESSKGSRKIELASNLKSAGDAMIREYVVTTDLYQGRVVRWLSGRLDPEIPTYDQIGEEDTANMLRGKVQ